MCKCNSESHLKLSKGHVYIGRWKHRRNIIDKSNSTSRISRIPAIVLQGRLQAPEESLIVADYQVLFKFPGGIVEGAVVLLATYYVFMYRYASSLNNVFFVFTKMHFSNH